MKYRQGLVFFLLTLVFVLSRCVIFNGFNGSDDLHYAMLAVNLLNGAYNPFEPNDIFSGRVLLISLQALIYKTGGISVLTTAAGTIAAIILSCLLTVSRLLPRPDLSTIAVACCLFYFNPALTEATIGILPDAYIMLAGTIIMVILKNNLAIAQQAGNQNLTGPACIGVIIAFSLLIKETALVFIPTVITLCLLSRFRKPARYILTMLGSFSVISFLYVLCYYFFAGDPFIKFAQIRNSSYPNPCNFALLPVGDLLTRLTYGVWMNFIVNGFYPVVLGLCVVLTGLLQRGITKNTSQVRARGAISDEPVGRTSGNFETRCFVVTLAVSLFFPFSLDGYQPLCADPRHFLFLIPFAVVPVAKHVTGFTSTRRRLYMSILVLVLVCACMVSTQNKWQWMIYWMFFAAFFLRYLMPATLRWACIAGISLISFVSIFENQFFQRSRWFSDMQTLKVRISAERQIAATPNNRDSLSSQNATAKPIAYYFADHDNMMHWKLLSRFRQSGIRYFNLNPDVFRVYKVYYDSPDTISFNPGWLIINQTYPDPSPGLVENLRSAKTLSLLPTMLAEGELVAYLISTPEQLKYVRSLIAPQANAGLPEQHQ